MTVNRYFAIARSASVALLALLLALGLAATAQAGTRMYTGTYTIQAFGNDTTTGGTIKLQGDDFSGYPWHENCHVGPYHAKETITFPTTMGLNTLMFTLPKYGGQTAVHDTNADGIDDRALGCLPSQNNIGEPISASGSLQTTGSVMGVRTANDPRGIDLAVGVFKHFQLGGTLSLQSYGPYAFDVQYTNFSNDSATFRAGAGIGNFTWSEQEMTAMANPRGIVVVKEGPNQFGGTMQMLGSFFSNEGFYYKAHLSVAKYSWLFQYNGAGGATTVGGEIAGPGVTTTPNPIVTTLNGALYPSNVFGIHFSWTTGQVSLTAVQGPFPTVLARKGFDNRNATGLGEIQMVTPMLTRWVWLSGNYETASIGHLRLNFTPEPQEWLMLAAGVSMLGLLYRSSWRSR